jgi:hypothetical protein
LQVLGGLETAAAGVVEKFPSGREAAASGLEVVQGDAELPKVVLARRPRGRLTGFLHGGNEQGDQSGDDGNHHQQLDEREARSSASTSESRDHQNLRQLGSLSPARAS